MKGLLSILLTVLMLLILVPTNVFAEESISDYVNINSDNITVSEPMTYDEIVEKYSNDTGIPIEEAKEIFDNQLKSYGIAQTRAAGDRYITISTEIEVTNAYFPTVNFYCYVNSDSHYGFIREVLNVSIDTDFNGTSYLFDGSIYFNLEDPTTIYYLVNGNWYKTGGGLSFSIGNSVASFGLSFSSGHYAYSYIEDRLNWGFLG